MQTQRRLWLLTFIAQCGRFPSSCTPEEKADLLGLVRPHAWPQMSLTRAGWAEVDRAGREALAQKQAS